VVLEEQEAGRREEEDKMASPNPAYRTGMFSSGGALPDFAITTRLQKISFTIFNQPLRLSQKGSLFQIKAPL
jgi:hypothetical protein